MGADNYCRRVVAVRSRTIWFATCSPQAGALERVDGTQEAKIAGIEIIAAMLKLLEGANLDVRECCFRI